MKNLFNRFRDSAGRSARTVGTCISTDGLSSTIQYPGGALVRVKGVGVPNQHYFVYAGRLDGDAPALANFIVDV